MKPKKLMLLGGSRYLLPAIEAAHKLGAYVITCDFLPDNYAHKFSDQYCNISLLDTMALLAKAKELKIDGVLGFANDIGVLPAAIIATEMGLPTPPLKSVEILQNKDKFRDFLAANGFNCPWHYSFDSKDAAYATLRANSKNVAHFPCIVKPVDSCGSKGCTRVDDWEALPMALDEAFAKCYNGKIIVEQFLAQVGASSDTDCFSIESELVFCSFDCQHFDRNSPNPYTPAAYSWPSNMPLSIQQDLRRELQRLIKLLDMGTTIYNVETRLAADGKPYIMEVSPRAGGNRLAEILRFATGQDLIENNIRAALRMELKPLSDPVYDGNWAEVIVHSNKSGKYRGIKIAEGFKGKIIQEDMWVRPGDEVVKFTGANQTIGTLVAQFECPESMDDAVRNPDSWLRVEVE